MKFSPYKKPQKLPVVLSPEEVLHFLWLRRTHQTSRDPDHLLRRWATHLGGRSPEAHTFAPVQGDINSQLRSMLRYQLRPPRKPARMNLPA